MRGDAVGGSRTEERPAPTPYTEPERHAPKRRRRMILPIEEPDDETTAAEAGGREPAADGTGSADDATNEDTPNAGTGKPGADEPHEPAMKDHETADGHEPTARDDGGRDASEPHDADAPEHGHGDDHTGRPDAGETASGKGDGTVDDRSSFRFDIPDLTMPRITFNGLPEADDGRDAR